MRIATASVLSVAVMMACGPASTSRDTAGTKEMTAARKQLEDHMQECTRRHGYDPEGASSLESNVLGPGERGWRECVYQGIEKYLIPKMQNPDLYRRAIAEDRKMTEAIAKGEMTRTQREARVEQMLKEIDQMEEASRTKHEMDRLEMEIRQDMMRRSLSPHIR